MKNDNKENLGSAVTCWIPKSLLAWIDAQRKECETRSSTIKRILRASWDFSEGFNRVSPDEYLPGVPKGSTPVLLEGDAHDLMVEEKSLNQG